MLGVITLKNKYHYQAIHVHRIYLVVKDIKRSTQFYTKNLGMSIYKTTSEYVSLTVNHQDEMIRLYENIDATSLDKKLGIYHFALLLPSRKDLSIFLKHLIKNQIPITGAADHLVSEAIYLQDPDGIGIEIASDRNQDYWDIDTLSVPMNTDPFDYSGVYYEDSENHVFDKLPIDTVIGHLHLQVKDVEKSSDFYKENIGFEITSKDFAGAVFMADAKYHHHLALNSWMSKQNTSSSENQIGLKSFTILYPMCEKLINTLNALKKHGIEVKETLEGYLITDVDNYKLLLDIRHTSI